MEHRDFISHTLSVLLDKDSVTCTLLTVGKAYRKLGRAKMPFAIKCS